MESSYNVAHTNSICIYLYIHTHIHPRRPRREWKHQLEVIEICHNATFHQEKMRRAGFYRQKLSCDTHMFVCTCTHMLCASTTAWNPETHKVLLTSTVQREKRKHGSPLGQRLGGLVSWTWMREFIGEFCWNTLHKRPTIYAQDFNSFILLHHEKLKDSQWKQIWNKMN